MIYLLRVPIIILAIISAFSFFAKPKAEEHAKSLGHPWEEYDATYFHRFQSVQSIISYADSCVGADKRNTIAYNNLIAEIIRKRFYHGFSHYQFSDNPLPYLSGRLFWDHLSAIVIPEEIMKHPMAACSQQSLVLAEIFKRNNIGYRKVSFNNHFAAEGFIDNKWHFFDPNMEPRLTARESLDRLIATDQLITAYGSTGLDNNYLNNILGTPKVGRYNEGLARNATTFHQICRLMVSKWFLFFAFALTFWNGIKMRVVKKLFKSGREKRMETKKDALAMAS